MPFSPQAWPSQYLQQRLAIQNIELGLAEAGQQVLTPTVQKSTEPSDAEIREAWLDFFGRSMPVHGRVQWFNPSTNRIENQYLSIDDVAPGQSSGAIRQLTPKSSGQGLYFLGGSLAEASGAASLVVSNIPQTYIDLIMLFGVRSTFNGTTASMSFRVNAQAAAYYQAQQMGGTLSGVFGLTGSEGLNQTGVGFTVPARQSTAGHFAHGLVFVRNYAAGRAPYGWMTLAAYNTNAYYNYTTTWMCSTAQAISSMSVIPAIVNSLEKDSYIAVFGLK